jgi:deazaflavin-dependent oxidoreductase (nitroreductase family)
MLHRWLYQASAGRIGGRLAGWPVLLLTTTGRRSGRRTTIALNYLQDGDRLVVTASNAGEPAHPSWYLNLRAHPRASVQVGGIQRTVVAADASPEERESLWRAIVAFDRSYAEYQARTSRLIPVVLLRPQA